MKLGFIYLESVVFLNFTGITAELEKSVLCTEQKVCSVCVCIWPWLMTVVQ